MGSGLTAAAAELEEIVALIGERAVILHAPSTNEAGAGLSGRDVDCAISQLDPMWPLRLRDGWRLCQELHYDLRGRYWVLEREGEVVALDTIEDPLGFGRDGIRTEAFLEGNWDRPSPGIRAAYLTIKRLRKGIASNQEWARIGRLAGENRAEYERALVLGAGPRLAGLVLRDALEGHPPSFEVASRARLLLRVRRFGSTTRLGSALWFGARRYVRRVKDPTGLRVLIVGPDGSGKSTLAERLPALAEGMFKRHRHIHWRPGVLPRPGAVVNRGPSDPSRPHARRPFGPVLSHLLLFYYWMDFVIGGWIVAWPTIIRAGLVVQERGWLDLAVDPRRYRLSVSPWLVSVMGRFMRRPDLVLVLEAPAHAVRSRKDELGTAELTRQATAWRGLSIPARQVIFVDTERAFDAVATEAREALLSYLETRTTSRLGSGWANLPRRASPRWFLPRGPRQRAAGSLAIYQPVTARGRVGWELTRFLAAAGAFRLIPAGAPPPRWVRELLAPHVPSRGSVAAARANHPDRYVGLIADDRGRRLCLGKMANGREGIEALESEEAALKALGPELPAPLSGPRILAAQPGLLLLDVVDWRPRGRPWVLEEEVAEALGAFFRSGAREVAGDLVGPTHGDCAPWNLLRGEHGWTLVDWESASSNGAPFEDVCHYIVQGCALLGRPSVDEVLDGFVRLEGWISAALVAYASGAGLAASEAPARLVGYLRGCEGHLKATTRRERIGLDIRRGLLRRLEAMS
jgi:hypothetical protein